MESELRSTILDSPQAWLVSIAAFGVFAIHVLKTVLAWVDTRRIKANGAADIPGNRSGSPDVLVLQQIASEVAKVRAAMQGLRVNEHAVATAAATITETARLTREIRDSQIQGDSKYISEAIMETRDLMRELLMVTRERGCPYLDRRGDTA